MMVYALTATRNAEMLDQNTLIVLSHMSDIIL